MTKRENIAFHVVLARKLLSRMFFSMTLIPACKPNFNKNKEEYLFSSPSQTCIEVKKGFKAFS